MRGKEVFQIHIFAPLGITPARAGKSRRLYRFVCYVGDHPRACGEKLMHPDLAEELPGSPPRVRGKEQGGGREESEKGITPARAGKSPISQNARGVSRDHPRACGEKVDEVLINESLLGSPPRVRGKGFRKNVENMPTGITPARAGKSTDLRKHISCSRDHPRACGEKK